MSEISRARLYVLRVFYLLIFLERAYRVAVKVAGPDPALVALDGVAYSFWGAMALLALLGVRHPLKMLPVLLIFLVYKILWLLIVALPMWSAGAAFDPQMTQFAWFMAIGAALAVIILPWGYLLSTFFGRGAASEQVTAASDTTDRGY